MWFGLISLFPDIFKALEWGVTGRAIKDGLLQLHHINPRDYTTDKHQSVDDKPYGGGPGMVMMAPPLKAALHAAKAAAKAMQQPVPTVIYLSPQGKRFDQAAAKSLAAKQSLVLLAGRYEGIDERIIQQEIDEEWSIGDFILTGGEFAALVMIDVMARLIPGTVGDQNSVDQDSFSQGYLKYPQYTRPEVFEGQKVPDILLSGHHGDIEIWRLKQALGQTWLKKPELLDQKKLNDQEVKLLKAFIAEYEKKTD